jgi:hypothetical protein
MPRLQNISKYWGSRRPGASRPNATPPACPLIRRVHRVPRRSGCRPWARRRHLVTLAELRGGVAIELEGRRERRLVLRQHRGKPGAEVAISQMPPMFTEWSLRPVSSACRVGEHSAVVWKRLNFDVVAGQLERGVVVLRLEIKADQGGRVILLREGGIPRKRIAVTVLHLVGAVDRDQRRDDKDVRRRRARLQPDGSLTCCVFNCACAGVAPTAQASRLPTNTLHEPGTGRRTGLPFRQRAYTAA